MSSTQNRRKLFTRALLAAALAAACCVPVAHAQYVGHINTQKNEPTLRSIAVLEYTGSLDHPTASRLIPIAVWNGESYQPGGLYLARPVPLTVETGTQYVLEQAGTPKGYFNVEAASNVGGSWIAIGKYQKPAPTVASNLKPSRVLPKIIGGQDDTPHFAHIPAAETSRVGAGNTTQSAAPKAPSVYAGRPTLTDRPANVSQPQQQTSAPASTSASTSTTSTEPPIMAGRPILRNPSANTASANSAATPPETVINAGDPNRPHLSYGKPYHPEQAAKEAQAEIEKLAGPMPDIEQMVAVSDAVNRPVHSYIYSWDSPEAEAKMQAKAEKIAQNLLAVSEKQAAPATPARTSHRSLRRERKPAAPPLPALTDVEFRAFQLAYGSGATLVFSATTGEGAQARYITLIAQPDFSGTPVVLFKQITSMPELDVLPRMKLIDAVDTQGNNRADLIFALETDRGRQYAIYQVANGTAQQVFVTGGWAASD